MNQISSVPLSRGITCRQIGPTDLEDIANLLAEGFPRRSAATWMVVLRRLDAHPAPTGFARYGYMLENAGGAVGVLLTIATALAGGESAIRCNISSWYVRQPFRFYASMLVSRAVKERSATYLNVSPAVATWPTIEAQGFLRFCNGSFAAVPILGPPSRGSRLSRITGRTVEDSLLAPHEWRLLRDHDRYGCLSLRCETSAGAYPFVFRRRLFKHHPLPCAQLIYCRNPGDLARCARPLGRFLALRGMPWVLAAANGPIEGLVGRYYAEKHPMYVMGPHRPQPNDLTYTEAAIFGL